MANPEVYTNTNGKVHESGRETAIGTEAETEIAFSANQVIMIADKPDRITIDYTPAIKYTGKFLYEKNNAVAIGICVDSKKELEYKKNDIISVLFMDVRALFSLNVRILNIREASPEDGFDSEDMTDELSSLSKYNKYIFEVLPLTGPERQQRREFFRMSLNIDIYYKIIEPLEVENIPGGDLKFNPEKAKEMKKLADNGLLENERGYLKLTTVDVSAGGFKYQSKEIIKPDTFLECLLVIDGEALPVIAQILSTKPDGESPGISEVRVLYYRISDPVKDRVVRHIFAQQRRIPSKFFKTKF